MSGKAFIPRDSLGAALDRLSKKIEVWVPAISEEGRWGVEFLPYRPGMRPVLDRQSTLSPKRVVFPQMETLLRFEYIKDPDDPAKVKFQLDDGQEVKPKFVSGRVPVMFGASSPSTGCSPRDLLSMGTTGIAGPTPFLPRSCAERGTRPVFARPWAVDRPTRRAAISG